MKEKDVDADQLTKELRQKERSAWHNTCYRYPDIFYACGWKENETGFDKFIAAVGKCPGFNYYISKKDSSKPYGPENICWHPMAPYVTSFRRPGRPHVYNFLRTDVKKEYTLWAAIKHKAKKAGEIFPLGWTTPPEGFISFLEYVTQLPPGAVFSKIDSEKPYMPGNVEWISKAEAFKRGWERKMSQ